MLSGLANRYAGHLLVLLVTFWVGAMWTVGFIVAPSLFNMIADRTLAGSIAGHLFAVVNTIGFAAGAYVLLYCVIRGVLRSAAAWVVIAMLVFACVTQFGIQPMMAELRATGLADEAVRERFGLWHGVSSLLYIAQSVLALLLVLRVRRVLPASGVGQPVPRVVPESE